MTALLVLTVSFSVTDDPILHPLTNVKAAQTGISRDEAAVIAAKATGGQVISSETKEIKGVNVYLIKVLMTDGRVRIVKVNSATGDIL